MIVNEKHARLVTGIFIGVAVYAILLFPNGQSVLKAAAVCLAVAATWELLRASEMKGKKRCGAAVYLFSIGMTILPSMLPSVAYSVFVMLVFIFFALVIVKTAKGKKMAMLHPAWNAALLSGMIGGVPLLRETNEGYFFLLVSVTAVFLTDVGAYHVGKHFGRRPLIPAVSPKKTIEGAAGGAGTAVVLLALLKTPISRIAGFECQWSTYLICVVLVSLAGQFGDLALSAVKRNDGIKDFGRILPGHGGVLDRFDSQIFASALVAGWLLTM